MADLWTGGHLLPQTWQSNDIAKLLICDNLPLSSRVCTAPHFHLICMKKIQSELFDGPSYLGMLLLLL